MRLYHISARLTDPLIKTFKPRIPASAADSEDQTIPRICFTPDPKRCLQATGYNFEIGDKILVYVLDTKYLTPSELWTPDELMEKQYVPDADLNQEYWVTETVTLAGNLYTILDLTQTTVVREHQYYPLVTNLTLQKSQKGENLCGTL